MTEIAATLTSVSPEEIGALLKMLDESPTLCHKADLLGLIDHPRANTFALTVPGRDTRKARSLEKLNKYLTSEERTYLGKLVEQKVKELRVINPSE